MCLKGKTFKPEYSTKLTLNIRERTETFFPAEFSLLKTPKEERDKEKDVEEILQAECQWQHTVAQLLMFCIYWRSRNS